MRALLVALLLLLVPGSGSADCLTAPTTLFFSPAGNDEATNSCRVASNPCKSLQRAYDRLQANTDLKGQGVTFLLAPGTYTEGLQATGALRGQKYPSQLTIRGNILTPSSVVMAPLFTAPSFSAAFGAMYQLEGLKFDHSLTAQDMILVGQYSTIGLGFVEFGYNFNPYNHVSVGFFGHLYVYGGYTISGGGQCHIDVANSAGVYFNTNGVGGLINVPVVGAPNFVAGFLYVASNASINAQAIGWDGAASGKRYVAEGNGVIDVGCTYALPGSVAGTLSTGGQYMANPGACPMLPTDVAAEMHLDAVPATVHAGETVTVSWRASGISAGPSCWVEAAPLPGTLTQLPDLDTTAHAGIAAWGQKSAVLTQTTTYTLHCLTQDGHQAASGPLTVTVQ